MKKAFIILAGILLLCGCSGRSGLSGMPEDEPWSKSVMETENGYYTNGNRIMFLHYSDKQTKANVFLCPRPQCSHDGNEDCPATYGYMHVYDSALYDGNIYIVTSRSENERVSVSLYKASLDGTSLDKVAEAFSIANSAGAEYSVSAYLSVHKGSAYVCYSIDMGENYSGITRVNIKTAQTEDILGSDEFKSGGVCNIQCVGHGDYVYFDYIKDNGEISIYRCDIKNGEVTRFRDGTLYGCAFSGGNMYTASANGFEVYDLASGRMTDEIFIDGYKSDFLLYDETFFLREFESPAIAAYSLSGEKLGRIELVCGDVKSSYSGFKDFDESDGYFDGLEGISDGKLYIRFSPDKDDENYAQITDRVYCCDTSDIISGTGEWTYAYDIKSLATAVNFEEAYAAIFGG